MTKRTKFETVQSAVEKVRASYSEGRDADHGFDAGEFGDAASAAAEEKEIEKVLADAGWTEDEYYKAEAEAEYFEDGDVVEDARERCSDCGEPGERKGHMSCQYPQD